MSNYEDWKELYASGYKIPSKLIRGHLYDKEPQFVNPRKDVPNVPFTDADNLGKLLPSTITSKKDKGLSGLYIKKEYNGLMIISYYPDVKIEGKTITKALLKMLLWLVKEGYVDEKKEGAA